MMNSGRANITRGVTYYLKHLYVQKKLFIDFTMKTKGMPLILQRGPGFLKPTSYDEKIVTGETMAQSGFIPAWHSDRETYKEPTPLEVMEAIDKFYETGYDGKAAMEDELNGVIFAGYGDPLCRLDDLLETCKLIVKRRPGAPVRINTLGLIEANEAFDVALKLKEVGVEAVGVSLSADNPVSYNKLISPEDGLGFNNVCNFIIALKESGLTVTCTAIDHQKDVSTSGIRSLSESLGADFISRAYRP